MNLYDYFDPVSLDKPENNNLSEKAVFCRNIQIHTPDTPAVDLKSFNVAILGIPEDRNASIEGPALAPDKIRNWLYQLFRVHSKLKIVDLGNIKRGKNIQDTYYALRDVTLELHNNNLITVYLGGSQDLSYGSFLAFENKGDKFNFVTIDSRLDMGIIGDDITSESYLIPILTRSTNLLSSYTNIGHQKYLVDQQDIDFLQERYYPTIRLGDVRSNISKIEPYLRDASFVSIDICAVRQSDAPGSTYPSPNGFFGDELCQISKYAGLSNTLSCYGIFNVVPEKDPFDQTSHLAAQAIWHFLEGLSQKIYETPASDPNSFKKFIVSLDSIENEIVFYKSLQTERWWFEVPISISGKKDHLLMSCSYSDYQEACNQEIPDRWWNAFKKHN